MLGAHTHNYRINMLPMYVRFRKGRQDLTGVKIWFDFQGYYQMRFLFTVNLLKKRRKKRRRYNSVLTRADFSWTKDYF